MISISKEDEFTLGLKWYRNPFVCEHIQKSRRGRKNKKFDETISLTPSKKNNKNIWKKVHTKNFLLILLLGGRIPWVFTCLLKLQVRVISLVTTFLASSFRFYWQKQNTQKKNLERICWNQATKSGNRKTTWNEWHDIDHHDTMTRTGGFTVESSECENAPYDCETWGPSVFW